MSTLLYSDVLMQRCTVKWQVMQHAVVSRHEWTGSSHPQYGACELGSADDASNCRPQRAALKTTALASRVILQLLLSACVMCLRQPWAQQLCG
jgi:hypothetical protein